MENYGLLGLRLLAGLTMLISHGIGKMTSFSEKAGTFPDLIGIGGKASLVLVIFAEVFCAAGVALGVATRLALAPLIINFLVAFFLAHGGDPWQKREMAFLYLGMYTVLMLTGPGAFSVDAWRSGRR